MFHPPRKARGGKGRSDRLQARWGQRTIPFHYQGPALSLLASFLGSTSRSLGVPGSHCSHCPHLHEMIAHHYPQSPSKNPYLDFHWLELGDKLFPDLISVDGTVIHVNWVTCLVGGRVNHVLPVWVEVGVVRVPNIMCCLHI